MHSPTPVWIFGLVNRLICLGLLIAVTSTSASGAVYYINNTATNGDVYTTAVGSDANNGLTPATPKLTFTNLFASYTLGAGDTVYIDTGVYTNTYTVSVTTSGSATNPLVFLGSTNYAAGGTVLDRNNASSDVWSLSSVSHVWLQHLTLRGGRDGVLLSTANDIRMERVIARNNSRHGVYVSPNSHRALMRNFIAVNNSGFQVRVQTSTNAVIDQSVLWGNQAVQYENVVGSLLFVSNSVLRASGFGNAVYLRTATVVADHNLYVLANNAVIGTTLAATINSTPRLSDWQAAYDIDWRSTVLDPLFADPDNVDFHPRSAFGRFIVSSGTFSNDSVTSPLIDMGSRLAPFANETSPNGGRVNVGAYGNTSEASRSSTNRTLLALSFNDGGVLSGPTARVYWVAGNATNGDTVRVEYSADGGSTWSLIATNVPATNETVVWNSTLFASSGAAKWRVRYEAGAFTNIVSTNVGFFSLRNTNLSFFVNDASSTGDVFTSAVGLPGNIATSNSPREQLEGVLTNHTVSAGDTIYIDAGYYVVTNTIFMNYRHRGAAGNPVRVVGAATNGAVGGPVLDRSNTLANVISLSSAPYVMFQHLDVRNGSAGLGLTQSEGVEIERCILRQNFTHGVDFGNSSHNGILRGSLVVNNAQRALTVGATNISIINNTIYGNRGVFSSVGTSFRFENNIIRVATVSGAVFETLAGTSLLGSPDYNIYQYESGSVMAREGVVTYANLSEYQKQFNRDWRSTVDNPQFANVAGLDFHVRSESGRWTGSAFTNDTVTSLSVDHGNPSAVFTNETAPNGGRINVGAFGNTAEASRSRTNAWLAALTYADGGVLNVPGDTIYWNAGGFPTGSTVRIELSTDSGGTWLNVATNLAVTNGLYTWANTNFLSSRFARWRVVYEADTNVLSATTSNFVFRNGPFVYYVNNSSTAGDVYTTAAGSDANLGTSPGAPKSTIKSVVDTHTLQPGDIIYVDTGTYTFSVNQEITNVDSGDTNAFVFILGSTNEAAGGTAFTRGSTFGSTYGLHLNGASYYLVRDIAFFNNFTGIRIENAPGVRLERVRAYGNSGPGVHVRASSGVSAVNSAAWLNGQYGFWQEVGGQLILNHVVSWRNTLNALRVDAGSALLSNSVLVANGSFASAYHSASITNIRANFNNVYLEDQALAATTTDNLWFDSLAGWTASSGQDVLSLSVDPLFANPSAGDFHLKTEATLGRFVPGVGFVVDSETSRLIDAGAPSSPFSLEPAPNGSRVNIGMYGHTTEASKSPTNQVLHAASLRQGGAVSGTTTLHWVSYNLPSSHLVRVTYSRDGGSTWATVATGLAAGAEAVAWNTTAVSNSPAGLWRVESESNPAVADQTAVFFSIRNGPLSVYLNDGSTSGDVYTTAPGAGTNWVATPAQPLNTLSAALAQFNLEPGDTLYIDTGTYSSSGLSIGRKHAGVSNASVVVVGSTNLVSGGTVLSGPGLSSSATALSLANTRFVALSNLIIRNARTGLLVDRSESVALTFLSALANSNGVVVRSSSNIVVSRSVLSHNPGIGFSNGGSSSTNRLEHSVILSNGLSGVDHSSGRLDVRSSVLAAYGLNSLVYNVQSNALLAANFNNVLTYDNASVARFGFSVSKALNRWQQLATNDLQSLSHEPLFANPSAGDYHPLSPAGRFDPALGTFVTTDVLVSPLIDAANPASDFSQESAPNGGRMNIGLYGNHPEASRSPTNARLFALTLNDGGSTRDTNTLYWLASGVATGHMVAIDYSHDGGVTWTNVVTNLSAAAGSYVWNTLPFTSTALGYWRIRSETEPGVLATNQRAFSLNNQPLAYYVNDTSTVGDVYTFAPGLAANDGLTEFSPVDSIQTILTRYDLQPGDRILIDTGFYPLTNAITLDNSRYVGSVTNSLRIIGSTNWAAGGTRISRNNSGSAFSFTRLNGVVLSHLAISNAQIGVRLVSSTNMVLEWLDIKGGGTGVELIGGDQTTLRNLIIREATTNALANLQSTGTVWQSGVLWSNATAITLGIPIPELVGGPANQVTVSNTVVMASGPNATVYRIASGTLRADYNNIVVTNGALVARVSGGFYTRLYDSVAHWRQETGEDFFSLSHDPLFADAPNGNFFLRSEAGRYDPDISAFVLDSETSPLIDAGAPTAAFSNEPAANGGRINIGRHGNSIFASKTPTNPALTIISLHDGGRVSGTSTIHWVARGAATGQVMTLSVSVNGGLTFASVATNVPGNASLYAWDTTSFTSTMRGVLAFVNNSVTAVMDRTDALFAIRNTNFSFFVNDSSTNGDMYATGPGLATNTGLSAAAPMPQLSDVLNTWDVEPGDTIYVDTGIYSNSSLITLTQLDAGSIAGTTAVTIAGSTNTAAGGTVLIGSPTNILLRLFEVSNVNLRDLTLRGAARPLLMRRAENLRLERVDIAGGQVAAEHDGSRHVEWSQSSIREATQFGLRISGSSNVSWNSGVLWSNQVAVMFNASTNYFGLSVEQQNVLLLSNTVVGAFGSNAVVYDARSSHRLFADHNAFFRTNGAALATVANTNGPVALLFASLERWSSQSGNDRSSLTQVDPLLANAAAGDFHPRSTAGRYDPLLGAFTNDAVDSMLIDAGSPFSVFTNETAPNGGRINIGRHGNSSEASRSPTNSRLQLLLYSDGGIAVGTNQAVTWMASGLATGHTVRLEVSVDGGLTWTNVATNLQAQAGSFAWNTTNYPSSPAALLRVSSEQEPGVVSTSVDYFAIRNTPLVFYVNDASVTGDVYTSAAGLSTNLGVSSLAPLDSLQSVLSRWNLAAGDTVYVDTGIYTNDSDIYFDQRDAGGFSNIVKVTILGSTNYPAGGSQLRRTSGNGIHVVGAGGLVFKDFRISGAATGIRLSSTEGIDFERIEVNSNVTGYAIENSANISFTRCVARNSSSLGIGLSGASNVRWLNGVIWSTPAGIQLSGSQQISVSNTVFGLFVTNANAYTLIGNTAQFFSDYNNFHLLNGARAGSQLATPVTRYRSLTDWVRLVGQDANSLSHDPLFADPEAGDFHLQSTAGRYVVSNGLFVIDATNSPLLDAGNPADAFTSETAPNGRRRNIGLHGNTAQASRTPTNASLTAVSVNDGGRVEGLKDLVWVARGAATGHTVRLEYSSDAGSTWSVIVSNLSASANRFSWDTRSFVSSVRGLWRITSEQEPAVSDVVDRLFALRNTGLAFYVNDGSSLGDVYTTAIGNATNLGVLASAPNNAVANIINLWDIEPGDTIYVDTGNYLLTSPIVLGPDQAWNDVTNLAALASGIATNRVLLQGSTNEAAGGSFLSIFGALDLIQVADAPGIAIRHMTLNGGSAGIRITSSPYTQVEWVRRQGGSVGFALLSSASCTFRHNVVRQSSTRGVEVLNSLSTVWQHGIAWSNPIAFYQDGGVQGQSSLLVENSIVGAFGSNSLAYFNVSGTHVSDYNNLYLANGAFAAAIRRSGSIVTTRFESISFWYNETGQDHHSLNVDPQFANVGAGDYHLKTTAPSGRYDAINGVWTNDATFSRLIDAGRPSSALGSEPAPNGQRVNIGLYGGTPEASRTPTNGWLSVLYPNDASSIRGTIELTWHAGGSSTGHLLQIDWSPVGDLQWTNIAMNVPASQESYTWNTLDYGKAACGQWRVVSLSNTSIYDNSRGCGTMRDNSGSIPYFVNDASTNGDVYCTSPGSVVNSGLLPSVPMRSIQDVINAYKLEPVDIIYVDTGNYLLTDSIRIGDLDSGQGTNRITIRGSTNVVAGGTVLNRQVPGFAGSSALLLQSASGLNIEHIIFREGESGVSLLNSEDITFSDIRSINNGRQGLSLSASEGIELARSVVAKNGTVTNGAGIVLADNSAIALVNSVLWDNFDGFSVNGSTLTATNSALGASYPNGRIFSFEIGASPSVVQADYNNYYVQSGALLAQQRQLTGGDIYFQFVQDWVNATSNDVHTLSHNPLFVDSTNLVFYLMSGSGRLTESGSLTNDMLFSPMIDAGNPASVWTNEPAPNGARVNIGAYGGTPQASRSPTNPWLLVISYNDGGVVKGTVNLRWTSGGFTNGSRVRVEYSRNDGAEWFVLSSNLLTSAAAYTWDASSELPTSRGRWRVVSEANNLLLDETDENFAVKNNTLTIFVNDLNSTGDVYTTSLGSNDNDGLSAAAPLLHPEVAFTRYPLGPGDLIYVDSGDYVITNSLRLDQFSRGESGLPIRVYGSTNAVAPSAIQVAGSGAGLTIIDTRDVEVSHLRFIGGSNVVQVIRSERTTLSDLMVSQGAIGYVYQNSQQAVLQRSAAWSNSQWGVSASVSGLDARNLILYGNTRGAIDISQTSLGLVNSILHAVAPTGVIYQINQSSLGTLDYNLFWLATNQPFARSVEFSFVVNSLSEWQNFSKVDYRSVRVEPGFRDAAAGDFGLLSTQGRFATNGLLEVDTTNSWAIDAGRPADAFDRETIPNGLRVNAGIHGNTELASLSSTNSADRRFFAGSLNDGGLASGLVPLYWLSTAFSPTSTVRIEYSINDRVTWNVATSSYPITEAPFMWETALISSSPLAWWRIVSEEDTNLTDEAGPFTLRNGPITYYVNDTGTVGDIYTVMPGSPTNNALSPNTPQTSIRTVLDRYDLEGGDIIYVDTGVYSLPEVISLTALDSGVSTARVSIIGADRYYSGGSVLQPDTGNTGAVAIVFSGGRHYLLDSLVFTGFANPVSFLQQSQQNIISNSLMRDGSGVGISFNNSVDNYVRRTVITRMGVAGVESSISALNFIEHSVIWSNASNAVIVGNGTLSVSNSILGVSSAGSVISLQTNGLVVGDYNGYSMNPAATFAFSGSEVYDRVPQWSQDTFQDFNSLHVEPFFADASNDNYFLQSAEGRFDPVSQTFVTTDTNTSWLIDAGPPPWDYGQEPTPNGTRINIGLQANTTQASKSRTNAYLKAITATGGGRLEGLVLLTWNFNNLPEEELVVLDYSYDNGATWTNIGTNVASARSHFWQSDQKHPGNIERFPSSPIARWRISLVSDTNVFDVTENYFSLRNQLFVFYLNDTNTAGDVYTCGPGDDNNLGIFPCEPKLTLESLLSTLDVEGDDIILIDTGIYPLGTSTVVHLTNADQGREGVPVVIRGSTNAAAGGSTFDRPVSGSASTLLALEGRHVLLEHLRFSRGNLSSAGFATLRDLVVTNGSMLLSGPEILAERNQIIRGTLSISSADSTAREFIIREGTATITGTNITFANNLVFGTNTQTALTLDGDGVVVERSTFATAGSAIHKTGSGSAFIRNNIIKASGVDRFCLDAQSGAIESDYNNFWAVNDAWVGGYRNGNWEKLLYWQRESGQDLNSIAANPRFANEAAGDFRLQSVVGRWTGTNWVQDAQHSPSIDAGSPLSAFELEPLPNGVRVNQGYDGNTARASLSQTNPWLIAVTMNDGGVLRGTNYLVWRYGSMTNGALVRLEYSPNNGSSWNTIASGLPVVQSNYYWDSTAFTSSLQALWRVVLESNTNVSDATDTTFQLRNTPLLFYVNDTSTTGDVFTTAVGNDSNSGTTPSAPKRTLQALLAAYDTEGGDVVYMDTGAYPISTLNRVNWSRGGDAEAGFVTIRGSTNLVAGGTVLTRNVPFPGSHVIEVPAPYVRLRDLTLQGGDYGIYSSSNRFVEVEGIFARSNEMGAVFNTTFNVLMRNLRVWNNRLGGIEIVNGRTTTLENATFVANSNYSYRLFGTAADVIQSSIFYQSYSNTVAFSGPATSFDNAFIDYNVYYFPEPTSHIFGAYNDLLQWQLDKKKDYRSAITNPLLHDVSSGDFHLRSIHGRYSGGIFVNDAESSWAIDRGNPASAFSNEPSFNGARINIGAFGGTPFASKSPTNRILETRTLNDPITIDDNSPTNIFPLIWGAINVPTGLIVNVQFSGDGGASWFNLQTNLSAYHEFVLWQASPFYNTKQGLWRVIGQDGSIVYADTNNAVLDVSFGDFRISNMFISSNRMNTFVWRGFWNEEYQVQQTDNGLLWSNSVSGVGPNRIANFMSTNGGDFTFEDVTSTNVRFRSYRVIWEQ
jgi:hypothetical protein